MIDSDYRARRAKLVNEFLHMKKLRLYRSAAARVRQIAELDFKFDGTPVEKTKAIFYYDQLTKNT